MTWYWSDRDGLTIRCRLPWFNSREFNDTGKVYFKHFNYIFHNSPPYPRVNFDNTLAATTFQLLRSICRVLLHNLRFISDILSTYTVLNLKYFIFPNLHDNFILNILIASIQSFCQIFGFCQLRKLTTIVRNWNLMSYRTLKADYSKLLFSSSLLSFWTYIGSISKFPGCPPNFSSTSSQTSNCCRELQLIVVTNICWVIVQRYFYVLSHILFMPKSISLLSSKTGVDPIAV